MTMMTLKKVQWMDMILITLFIVFLAAPFKIPTILAQWIDSPLGIVIVSCVAFYMFFCTNPVLGVISLIAAYELFRRSATSIGSVGNSVNQLLYGPAATIPTEASRTREIVEMNPTRQHTLEEEMINKLAPIGQSPVTIGNIETQFKPVIDNDHGASFI